MIGYHEFPMAGALVGVCVLGHIVRAKVKLQTATGCTFKD
jgi:hypothetical protein